MRNVLDAEMCLLHRRCIMEEGRASAGGRCFTSGKNDDENEVFTQNPQTVAKLTALKMKKLICLMRQDYRFRGATEN